VLAFEPAPADAGTGLVVELSPPDALAADDRAFARVPASRKLPIFVAPHSASPWVRRALSADPDTEIVEITVAELEAAATPHDALVVADGVCPRAAGGVHLLVLNPKPGPCRTLNVGDALEQPLVVGWADSDPRMRFLNLDGVQVLRAHRLRTDSPRDELIRTRQGAIAADASLPGQVATIVGFDVGESNWPLKASFVLFVRNIMEQAREQRARGVVGSAQTGDAVRVRVPIDVTEVAVETPRGERRRGTAHGALAVLPEAADAGFYFVTWQGNHPGSVLLPANLGSETESDVTPRAWHSTNAGAGPRTSQLPGSHSQWEWLFALLALAVIVADVWWWTRRSPAPRSVLGSVR
jgi:hypothetical protein